MSSPESSSPDLKDLVEAVNDTSRTARNVVNAMLVVAVTLGATIIGTTDEALLRETTEVIPTLGVSISLVTMYSLAPLVFLFLHANALLQLQVLIKHLTAFKKELNEVCKNDDDAKEKWRQMLHGFAFTQHHGSRNLETTRNLVDSGQSFLQWAMIMLFVAVLPLLLLVLTQISFVSYQDWLTTSFHKLYVG